MVGTSNFHPSPMAHFGDITSMVGILLHADCCQHFMVYPIGSMYGIYANIWGILMVNVTIYDIHGSYGILLNRPFGLVEIWWTLVYNNTIYNTPTCNDGSKITNGYRNLRIYRIYKKTNIYIYIYMIHIYMIYYDIWWYMYIHTLYSNHQKGRKNNSFANIVVGTFFFSIVSGVAMDLFEATPKCCQTNYCFYNLQTNISKSKNQQTFKEWT